MTMMMTPSLALEQQVAIAAVRRACTLTTTVFNKLVAGETAIKDDNSPVTVADYSAQAVINTILSRAFPFDPIVGEEDSADLRANTPEASSLRARVVELASDILAQPARSYYPSSSSSSSSSDSSDSSDSSYFWEDGGDSGVGGGGSGELMDGNESAEWGLGKRWTAESLLDAIDRGNYRGGRSGRTSFPH
jgi:3'(2'), 5'-bisphosphate nucleotidase